MSFPKIRHKCGRCGGTGVLYRDTEPYPSPASDGGLFHVMCEVCWADTLGWCTAPLAIRNWNYLNDPERRPEKGGAR